MISRNDTYFPGSFVAAPPDGPTALGVNFISSIVKAKYFDIKN